MRAFVNPGGRIKLRAAGSAEAAGERPRGRPRAGQSAPSPLAE